MDSGTAPRLDEYGFPVKDPHPNVFEIYSREANTYDTAMVERWRTAMEGLLIFAGLFSGVVTNFIIQSYKSLQPNQSDQMVVLLAQISQQLAALNDGTPSTPLPGFPGSPFSPSWTAVLTNVLWFISLGLSLACAVTATLVQQWARSYVHTIERRPSAKRRAHMRMYLYDGVERFGMSQLIDGVPALMHLALFTFLLGLVFFIQPISLPITIISAIILLLSVVAYLFATLLPLVAHNSPIQTPLTSVVWQKSFIQFFYWTCANTLVLAIAFRSLLADPLRITWTTLDLLALCWASKLRTQLSRIISRIPTIPHFFPTRPAFHEHHQEVVRRWSAADVESKNFDAVKAHIARDEGVMSFWDREKRAFTWLVECLDEDREILQFLEAVPTFTAGNAGNDDDDLHAIDRQRSIMTFLTNPELELPRRLFKLVRRHKRNPRVTTAYVDFYLSINKKFWVQLLPIIVEPHYFWPGNWRLRFNPSAELSLKICCLEATVNFSLSMRLPKSLKSRSQWSDYGLTSFIRDVHSSSTHSTVLKFWRQLFPSTMDLESFLLHQSNAVPYLVLAKLHLDALPFLTVTNYRPFLDTVDDLYDQLYQTQRPRSDSSKPFTAFSSQEQVLCATAELILSELDSACSEELMEHIWSIYSYLLDDLLQVTDSCSLRIVNRVLQNRFWMQGRDWLKHKVFNDLVAAHSEKQNVVGEYYISPLVKERSKVFGIGWLSKESLAHKMKLVGSVNLIGADANLQMLFILGLRDFLYWTRQSLALVSGIDEIVLLFEVVMEKFYTLNDLESLHGALALVDWFLRPDQFPYHQLGIECRDYLCSTIAEKSRQDFAVQVNIRVRPERGIQADPGQEESS